MKNLIEKEFLAASTVFNDFTNEDTYSAIEQAAKVMIASLNSGGKLISFGNGGSMSDAQHFASELSGRFRGNRNAIAAISLSDPAATTCIANDFGYTQLFKRQLEAIGKPGDVVLALSASGNSENVIIAAEYARRVGMKVVGICSNKGKMIPYCDVVVQVPHSGTCDRVQEVTIIVIHILVMLIERSLDGTFERSKRERYIS